MLKSFFKVTIFFLLISCSSSNTSSVNPHLKSQWISRAFETISSGEYPQIKAVSWWHENFTGTFLRVDSSPQSIQAYTEGVSNEVFVSEAVFENEKLLPPSGNQVYHAAYPDFGGTEDIVTDERIYYFEDLVQKEITWAYFSNNWIDDILFPTQAVNTILSTGKIPFIRLMARSNFNEDEPDPVYSMQRIIDGDFDNQLTQWAIEASNSQTPLLVEFGTEVNGSWFPWNGVYNGGATTGQYGDPNLPDGPERFRDAYRHIIDVCRNNGATNITWFFHVDAEGQPDEDWNQIANYYPGDEYIDWVGASVYGSHFQEDDYIEFSDKLDMIYPNLVNLTQKPIAILEFAITELE